MTAGARPEGRYRRRPDPPEGSPPRPIPKANETVWVARSLSVDEEQTLATVQRWIKQGRSSCATFSLSATIDDPGGWVPPNVRLSHRSGRVLAWWRLCALRAVAAQRDQLEDFKALVLHIEGVEVDDMSLARGIELARQMIKAISGRGRERRFVEKHHLDRPEVEEPQRELG